MRKLLLTILLIGVLSVKGQELFKPGYFLKGTIVKDDAGVLWKAKVSVNAKAAPKTGTYWELVTTAPIPVPLPVPITTYVKQASFDSLLQQFNFLSDRVKKVEAKQSEPTELTSILKFSQLGAGLLKIVNDSTTIGRSFIPSQDIDFIITDTTIQPVLKKH